MRGCHSPRSGRHHAGIELPAIDAHRAAVTAADLERITVDELKAMIRRLPQNPSRHPGPFSSGSDIAVRISFKKKNWPKQDFGSSRDALQPRPGPSSIDDASQVIPQNAASTAPISCHLCGNQDMAVRISFLS
jgi:hypothetical protein